MSGPTWQIACSLASSRIKMEKKIAGQIVERLPDTQMFM